MNMACFVANLGLWNGLALFILCWYQFFRGNIGARFTPRSWRGSVPMNNSPFSVYFHLFDAHSEWFPRRRIPQRAPW